jgi:alpha-mannosidase
MMRIRAALIAVTLAAVPSFALLRADSPPRTRSTLWVIPHTHWEATVFKTREQYLDMGLHHILHALQLLEQYPDYTFVLDQAAYVKPFLERYPEHEQRFRKFIAEGRLEIVLGMNVMPDDNQPGGESFVRQIQYGKGYYRRKLGVEVTTGWLLDTFGHNAQIPQLLKLGGYKSFWFFRGVSSRTHPSEFLWEGIDGTRIPAVWMPHSYGMFWGAPADLGQFEAFAKRKFDSLTPFSHSPERVALAGVDVCDPEDQLPAVMKKFHESGHDLGFDVRFGVPSQVDAALARHTDLPVVKGEMNPIFQGIYSSRIEMKQLNRALEHSLTTAEKLGAICDLLGPPTDRGELWRAWEPVLFYHAHDPASGIMSDEVYAEANRELDSARRLADGFTDERWDKMAAAIDTRSAGTPLVVFNPLGWERTDVAEVMLGFVEPGVTAIAITDPAGAEMPVQILDTIRGKDGGIRRARVAFIARGVPAVGYTVYHAAGRHAAEPTPAPHAQPVLLENEHYRIGFDAHTGAITSLRVKAGDWDAISGPANVVSRQEDKGDLWELYRGLDGGSRIAMTGKQPVPIAGPTTKLSTEFHATPGNVRIGPIYSDFSVAHPLDDGKFATTVRLTPGSRRIEITTRLVNAKKLVRYQALFPTTIANGHSVQAIPFGAIERPNGIEFPAQDWVDFGNGERGVALLNVGMPGNVVTDGTMMLSLLRAHTLGGYGIGGGFEATTTSDTGYELGQERTLHYALVPHAGDWRQAEIYREGMEFSHPLLCRKTAPHVGRLPPRWGLLSLSQPAVVVSAIQSGRDGTMNLRVFETTGRPAPAIKLTVAANITAASEINFLEDPGAPLKPAGNSLIFYLAPFQIKTINLRLSLGPP